MHFLSPSDAHRDKLHFHWLKGYNSPYVGDRDRLMKTNVPDKLWVWGAGGKERRGAIISPFPPMKTPQGMV